MRFVSPVGLPNYTNAGLPSASTEGAGALAWDTTNNIPEVSNGTTYNGVMLRDLAGQVVSGGATVTSASLGTASGTVTINCGTCPLQYITGSSSAWTIAAPAADGSTMVLLTNNVTTPQIPTFSGFSVGANTGDALDTTASHKFTISIWRINATSGYRIAAHQ
jgi:hypothetical protein